MIARFVLVVLALFCPGLASAAVSPVAKYIAQSSPAVSHDDVASACSSAASHVSAKGPFAGWDGETTPPTDTQFHSCRWSRVENGNTYTDRVGLVARLLNQCPVNSTGSGGVCSCDEGFKESSGQCVAGGGPVEDACNEIKGALWVNLETKQSYGSVGTSVCARPNT